MRLTHGPAAGPYNRLFLWLFIAVFVLLFSLTATIKSLQFSDELSIMGALKQTLLGAIIGYVASLLAVVDIIFRHTQMTPSLSDGLAGLSYAAVVLLINTRAWLFGMVCGLTYQAVVWLQKRDIINKLSNDPDVTRTAH